MTTRDQAARGGLLALYALTAGSLGLGYFILRRHESRFQTVAGVYEYIDNEFSKHDRQLQDLNDNLRSITRRLRALEQAERVGQIPPPLK